jgi:hypothetical protein
MDIRGVDVCKALTEGTRASLSARMKGEVSYLLVPE